MQTSTLTKLKYLLNRASHSRGPVMWQGRFPCEDEEADDEVVQQQLDYDNAGVANANVTHEERKKN